MEPLESSANDDELDQLIRETQNIWKSLAASPSVNASTTAPPNNNNSILSASFTTPATSRINPMNASRRFSLGSIQESGKSDRSHRLDLESLNLETPSFALRSRASDAPFTTPASLSRSKDGMFGRFPSPVHITPMSEITPQRAHHQIDAVDFSDICWHEVNTLLARCGFPILMKQHTANFEPVPGQEIICESFKQVLAEYDKLRSQARETAIKSQQFDALSESYEELQKHFNELQERNQELTAQLTASEEKIKNLREESQTHLSQNKRVDTQYHAQVSDLERQVHTARRELNRKDQEIQQLKERIEHGFENDSLRRKAAESVFESVRKRTPKASRMDQQMVDMIEVFDEERKKMQREIKHLRKEMKSVTSKLGDVIPDGSQPKRFPAEHVSICSSQINSDDEDENAPVDARPEMESELSPRPRNTNRNRSRSANDAFSAETLRLSKRLEKLSSKLQETQEKMTDVIEENQKLKEGSDNRPSVRDFNKIREQLAKKERELREAKSVANVRKYLDTRELIKRDKDIHELKLDRVNELPKQIVREILQDVCRILSVSDVSMIVNVVEKMALVVKTMPALEQLIQRLVRIMLASEHAPQLVQLHQKNTKRVFEHVIPTLQDWISRLDKSSTLENFRSNVNAVILKRTIGNKIQGTEGLLPLHELLRQVQELVESEEYLLGTREMYANVQRGVPSGGDDHRIITHLQHLFDIKTVEGIFPKLNTIYVELSEMKNFLSTLRSILGLDENAGVNKCFKVLQEMIANNGDLKVNPSKDVKDHSGDTIEKWSDTMMTLSNVLHVSEDSIVSKCQEMAARCEEYDAVFPRVQNLVSQLRTQLNVEHAHEILPRVIQLCESSD